MVCFQSHSFTLMILLLVKVCFLTAIHVRHVIVIVTVATRNLYAGEEAVIKMIQPMLAALKTVARLTAGCLPASAEDVTKPAHRMLTALVEAVLKKMQPVRAALAEDVTKPAQRVPPALEVTAHLILILFLLRRVVISGPKS